MSVLRANQELERLRRYRAIRDPQWSIAPVVGAVRRELATASRSTGKVEEAWARVVPLTLQERSAVVRLVRGVLTVRTEDASTRWELDRFLKSGGATALMRAAAAGVKKVKLV